MRSAVGPGLPRGQKTLLRRCGAAGVRPVPQRAYGRGCFESAVVDLKLPLLPALSTPVLPGSRPASAALHGSTGAGACVRVFRDTFVQRGRGPGDLLGAALKERADWRESCAKPVPQRCEYPRVFPSPCFSTCPFPGKRRSGWPLIGAEACYHGLSPRPCLLTCEGVGPTLSLQFNSLRALLSSFWGCESDKSP